jgi:hypothetical protein
MMPGPASCQRQQTWIIQIGGNNHSPLVAGTLNNFAVGGLRQSDFAGMQRIVSIAAEPRGQFRRERHINQEFHRQNSTVSSSANMAA